VVAPIGRVQTVLTGFAGGPGLINLYWNGASPGAFTGTDATAAIAAVHTLMGGLAAAFASGVALQVQPVVEVLEATNGQVISLVAGTPVASVAGAQSGQMLLAEGPLIQWFTGVVVGRHLLRGRTFLTPAASGDLDSGGVVSAALIAILVAAGATYIAHTGQQPVIWHRPKPYGTGTNGEAAVVTACSVQNKVAVLRSRRD